LGEDVVVPAVLVAVPVLTAGEATPPVEPAADVVPPAAGVVAEEVGRAVPPPGAADTGARELGTGRSISL
jgi:hypothetical protein